MQARAIFEAAAEVQKSGIKVNPEVMIPLVGFKRELDLQVEIVHRVAQDVQAAKKVKLNYLVGTMIEVPRGALTADEIAKQRSFLASARMISLRLRSDESRRQRLVFAALRRAGNRETKSLCPRSIKMVSAN
jgi:citrate lyase beta subunit